MSAHPDDPGRDAREVLHIVYRNWRGEVATRVVLPKRIWFGSTDWHPEAQWLLEAYDVERQSERSFAMKDIIRFMDNGVDVPHGPATSRTAL